MIFSLITLILTIASANSYSCKSPKGNDVDWFVVYKLPIVESQSPNSRLLQKGAAFLYADQRSTSWIMSGVGVDDKTSAIGQTVAQMFQAKRNKDEFYALYNDESPEGKVDSGRGHMKGSLVFDDISGFWLIHSVPNFPATSTGGYMYPDSGLRNGQSFLCITFSSAALKEIGTQLLVGTATFFESQLPESFARLYPDLALAIEQKKFPSSRPPSSVIELQSLKGETFTSFYKHKKFQKDLYEDLMAANLRSSLYVETWLNGPGDLPSECDSPYKVYNVRTVRPLNFNFNSSKDHSKWAVSATEKGKPWICIGDINRQKSQERRGGGSVCLQNAKISSLYRLAVADTECCGGQQDQNAVESADDTDNPPFENCVLPPKPSPPKRKRKTQKKKPKHLMHKFMRKFLRFIGHTHAKSKDSSTALED